MRSSGSRHFRKTQLAGRLGLGAFDGQQRDGSHHRQRQFLRPELFQLRFDVGFFEQVGSDLGRIQNARSVRLSSPNLIRSGERDMWRLSET